MGGLKQYGAMARYVELARGAIKRSYFTRSRGASEWAGIQCRWVEFGWRSGFFAAKAQAGYVFGL